MLVRYPDVRNRCIQVGIVVGNVNAPFFCVPRLCGYIPVARLNRAGMHTGAVVMQVENVAASPCSASRFGVRLQPFTAPRLSARCWSVMTNNTFGRRAFNCDPPVFRAA